MANKDEELSRFRDEKTVLCNKRGCWLWQGEIDKFGYGRAWFKGFRYQAHRLLYWLAGAKNFNLDDRKQEIEHLCEVRNCVNPDHLEITNRKTNMKRVHRRRKKIDENGNLVGGISKW